MKEMLTSAKGIAYAIGCFMFGFLLGRIAWSLISGGEFTLWSTKPRKKPEPVDHGYPKMGYPGDDT